MEMRRIGVGKGFRGRLTLGRLTLLVLGLLLLQSTTLISTVSVAGVVTDASTLSANATVPTGSKFKPGSSSEWIYYRRTIKGFEKTSFREIWRARTNGSAQTCVAPAAEEPLGVQTFDVSPDGRYLLRVEERFWHGEKSRVYLYDLVAGTRRPLTPAKWHVYQPQFSPDGRKIAFIREPKPLLFGEGKLYTMRREGSRKRLAAADIGVSDFSWKYNSREIAFVDNRFLEILNLRSGKRRWFVGYNGMDGYAAPVVEGIGPWTKRRGLYYLSMFIHDPDFGGTKRNEPHPGIYRTKRRVKVKGAQVRGFGSRFSRRGGMLPGHLTTLSDQRTLLGGYKGTIRRLSPGRIKSLGIIRGHSPHVRGLPEGSLSCGETAEKFTPSPDAQRLRVPFPSAAALRAERTGR